MLRRLKRNLCKAGGFFYEYWPWNRGNILTLAFMILFSRWFLLVLALYLLGWRLWERHCR